MDPQGRSYYIYGFGFYISGLGNIKRRSEKEMKVTHITYFLFTKIIVIKKIVYAMKCDY